MNESVIVIKPELPPKNISLINEKVVTEMVTTGYVNEEEGVSHFANLQNLPKGI